MKTLSKSLCLWAAMASALAAADDFLVERIDPVAAGMSVERLARLESRIKEFVDTPPGFEESLSLPGGRGGSNWGTGRPIPRKEWSS